jgi:hypothetical protein
MQRPARPTELDGGDMKHATSLALHAYWLGCHGRGGVPAGQIRAAELAPILPSLFLIELNLSAGARFRFCGAAIARRYGRDLTHESFLALWNPEDRELLERDLGMMAARSSGLVAGLVAETVGGGVTSFEMLVLPLVGEATAAGAIGSMVRIGGHEELNRVRARILCQSLRSTRFLPPVGQPSMRGGAPLPLTLAKPSQTRRRYGHLTVVSGGK